MSFILVALGQAAIAAAIVPYPAASVLESFGEACRNVQDLEQVENDLKAQDWKAEIPAEDSPLGKLLAIGRAGAAKVLDDPDDKMSDTRVFTKTISGERLDIILSSVESGDMFVNGCRLYDVNETRKIDLAAVEKWMDREPTRTNDSEHISVMNWSPGYIESHDSFEVYYVPEGNPIIALTQFNGIALKADFVGETKK